MVYPSRSQLALDSSAKSAISNRCVIYDLKHNAGEMVSLVPQPPLTWTESAWFSSCSIKI